MITLYGAGYRVACDETIPCVERHTVRSVSHLHPCGATIDITPLVGDGRIDGVLAAARDSGWRVHLLASRRDLCPTHAATARRRFTLISYEKG